MEILHLSAECYPVAKAGGLGDVVGALPKYQCKAGHTAKVIMPMYHTKFIAQNEFNNEHESDFQMGPFRFHYRVMKEKHNKLGYDLYLIDIPGLFDRDQIYGYQDDTERFIGFQIAVLDWIAQWQHRPDVIHCHDHHTALVPFLMQYAYKYHHLSNIKTVLTIHNGLYQGWMPWKNASLLPEYDTWKAGLLDWNGMINPLSSAVRCANAVTTVSWSYMHELMEDANGLESLFRSFHYKCFGILNGIDNEVWNPENDKYIDFHYNNENVDEAKLQNKRELCSIFNLNPDKPLIVFIGRAVAEKGADILPQAIGRAISEVQGACSFLVLGSGEKSIEMNFEGLKHHFDGHYNCYIGYNEGLSHKMYAGADFLIMPSRVEPCGLNQMYALRYGTIPIVRNTGGLKDTVIDIGENGGYGLRFNKASINDIVYSTHRAVEFYYDYPDSLKLVRQRMMAIDNSWEKSAERYLNLYQH
jgi:starch synthase